MTIELIQFGRFSVGEVEGEVVGMEEVVVDMEKEGMAEAIVGVEVAIPAACVNWRPYEEISEMTTCPTQNKMYTVDHL